MGNVVVSSVGMADDTALLSNDIHHLYYLLELSKFFCSKYEASLCPEKTILQVYQPKQLSADSYEIYNPIKIDGRSIPFSSTADHVGILRSTNGNKPTLLARISTHKRALAALLHSGLALDHKANPVFSLKLHQLYCIPVLLSGLSAVVLSEADTDIIDKHFCETLRKLLRLLPKTPRSVVYFLAGSLPGRALLHQRRLMLFSMITRLENDILKTHAVSIFEFGVISKKSWFHHIRTLCIMYSLPYPLDLLVSPMKKEVFKNLVKKKIMSYWEVRLRSEASELSSLSFFNPSRMSISRPHPLFRTAGSSPSKVSMASIQAIMLSGRYRTESLLSHWTRNSEGFCKLSMECSGVKEDIRHILHYCPALSNVRANLIDFTRKYCSNLDPTISSILLELCDPSHTLFCEFILDCSTIPRVITLVQSLGEGALDPLFDVSRIWIFVLHRERLKRLHRWKHS